ncbi:MAG: hypothetical protein AAFO02_22320 [Bacteroidota bacterium]
MKSLIVLCTCLLTFSVSDIPQTTDSTDLEVLVGHWQLDMSPQDQTDDNFAMMTISKIDGNSFTGEFYREGVEIRNAQTNTQLGIIYGALISGDRSGTYNTTFYYKDGILHGTTHAVDKNFLAVWTAVKVKQ